MSRGKLRVWALFGLLAAVPPAFLWAGQMREPLRVDTDEAYTAPTWGRPFGTDALGRDMLARTLYAAGLSLRVATQAVAVSLALAILLGGIAGYTAGRWPDRIISWVISLLYTVPFILIVVSLLALIEPGIEQAYLLIGLIGWPAPARLARAAVIEVRGSRYVFAQRAYGFAPSRILASTLVPRSVMPAVLSSAYFVPELIGVEVGLSFFGVGAPPPTPTLGNLIYDGLSEYHTAWWLSMAPACVLMATTTAVLASTHALVRKPTATGRND